MVLRHFTVDNRRPILLARYYSYFKLFSIANFRATMTQSIPILLTSLLLLIDQLTSTQASGHTKTCTQEDILRGPARGALCGPHLANILSVICPNGYHTFKTDTEFTTRHYVPFISVHRAKSSVRSKKWDSSWTGIVCECCYNRCFFGQLLEYCHTSNRIPSYTKSSDSSNSARSQGSKWLALGKRILHTFSRDSRPSTK
ncbi:molluscan insulin-related peptide 3-like [Lineus longissimus]|uniref:molluscan insulin-related peptide 3-like n=1 Tax=Lineus longissimus TaxID=88925 RepID=UPI00315CA2A6